MRNGIAGRQADDLYLNGILCFYTFHFVLIIHEIKPDIRLTVSLRHTQGKALALSLVSFGYICLHCIKICLFFWACFYWAKHPHIPLLMSRE